MHKSTPTPFECFILLSVQLCGITSFDLLGTGYAERYFVHVQNAVDPDVMGKLLYIVATMPDNALQRKHVLETTILHDKVFGPICQKIMTLWYSATWPGPTPDKDEVPFPYAYTDALLGPAVGAHQAGAKPTGHQTWMEPPVYLPIPAECL